MSEHNVSDIWQVEVGGHLYEAPFIELRDWIAEGSLQPEDKVRKGNLRWIEARKVPSLTPFFDAKEKGLAIPIAVSVVDAGGSETNPIFPILPLGDLNAPLNGRVVDLGVCAIHPQLEGIYVCDSCGSGYCKTCPRSYGGSVKVCPSCGSMCRGRAQVERQQSEKSFRSAAISEGFGLADFFAALSRPFRFKTSLIFGAATFAAFSLGQSVTAVGGIYMIVAAIFCMMLANMLTFGVLAHTVENFSQGRVEVNFMPDFEDFSLWEDVVHPFFLSIGAYLAAFGPFLVVAVIGAYLVMGSVSSRMDAVQSDLEKLPGTHYYDAQRTLKQSDAVKDVLGNVANKERDRVSAYEEAAAGNASALPEPRRDEAEELWAQAQEGRKKEFEAVVGKSTETRAMENAATLQAFLNLAAPLIVVGGALLAWGLFYFPAACAVAGYTRSFTATLDPTVGLDTIKRLGVSYIKLLAMGLFLMIAAGITSSLLGAFLAPFDLPGFGNIPAKAVGSVISFYFWVVFSCMLGLAMFKASDRLALPR